MTENKYKITRSLVFGSSLRFGVKCGVLGRYWVTRGKDALGSRVFFVLSSPSSGLSVSRRARLRARRNIHGEQAPQLLRLVSTPYCPPYRRITRTAESAARSSGAMCAYASYTVSVFPEDVA